MVGSGLPIALSYLFFFTYIIHHSHVCVSAGDSDLNLVFILLFSYYFSLYYFHSIHSWFLRYSHYLLFFTLFVVFKLFMHVPHYSRLFPRYVILHNNTIIPTSSFIAETSLLFWFCILLLPNHFHPSFRLICFNYSYSFLFPPSYSFSNPPHDPFSLFSLFLFCSRQTPASNKITITVLSLPTS